MKEQDWRGSFAIPMTPYDEKDRIDEDVLRAEIEFCIQAGTRGLVVPVLVSEFYVLSEAERRLMVRIAVETSAGRVPVVANCAAVNTPLAVSYARDFQEYGADAVIAMPPYITRPDWENIYCLLPGHFGRGAHPGMDPEYQRDRAFHRPGGQPVRADRARVLGQGRGGPQPAPYRRAGSAQNPAVHGVMGGAGGRYLMTEWARGSKGVVHACQFCDVIQRIWDLLDGGDLAAGGDLYEHILPGLVLEGLMGMAYAKEIMIRRGVFKNRRMRLKAKTLKRMICVKLTASGSGSSLI